MSDSTTFHRYMPPVTPSTWKSTRLADRFSPVCPQAVPVSDTGMEALLEMPRGRLAQLRRMKPLLTNHSEDCLYLNMYVPREGEFPLFLCFHVFFFSNDIQCEPIGNNNNQRNTRKMK